MGVFLLSHAYSQETPDYVPGEYIIKTNPKAVRAFTKGSSNFRDILKKVFKDKMPVSAQDANKKIKEYQTLKQFYHLKLSEDLDPKFIESEIKKEAGKDSIEYVERDQYVHAMSEGENGEVWTPGLAPELGDKNPKFEIPVKAKLKKREQDNHFTSALWGLKEIDILKAWKETQGEREIVVGVVDTGVQYNHPDLIKNIWVNLREIPDNGKDDDDNGFIDDTIGWDFVNDDAYPYDDGGHGTHVAGSIAAAGPSLKGVAPNVRIMPLKFLGSNGSGKTSDAIYCIDYALTNGAHIINNSWGGGGFSRSLYEAIKRTQEAGILFIVAAGNSTNNNDRSPSYPSSYKLDNVLSVAAVDKYGKIASFSNYGSKSVHVGAPGVKIYSSYPKSTYKYLNGTSMACPYASGVAALILSKWSYLAPKEVYELMRKTLTPLSSLKSKTFWGGIINAGNALTVSDPLKVPEPGTGGGGEPDSDFSLKSVGLYMKKETKGPRRVISLYLKEKKEGQLVQIKEVSYSLVGSSIPTITRTSAENNFLFKFYTYRREYILNFKILTNDGESFYKSYKLNTK